MAFENSPRLDKPGASSVSFLGRVHQLRWVFLALAVLAILATLAATAYLAVPLLNPPPPGGLDGCLASESGAALSANLRVGSARAAADPDGCFFFWDLPPGPQQLIIQTASGESSLPVTIVSGQAISLGVVTLK